MKPTSRAAQGRRDRARDRAAAPDAPSTARPLPTSSAAASTTTSPGRRRVSRVARATCADRVRRSSTVRRTSPSTIASVRAVGARQPVEQRLVGPHAGARHSACTSGGAGCARSCRSPSLRAVDRRGRRRLREQLAHGRADLGRLPARAAVDARDRAASRRRPRSSPPSTSNTRPVTSRESALPSHTTSGEMLAGSFASNPESGACMRSANTSSVMRVRAAGAIAFAVTP